MGVRSPPGRSQANCGGRPGAAVPGGGDDAPPALVLALWPRLALARLRRRCVYTAESPRRRPTRDGVGAAEEERGRVRRGRERGGCGRSLKIDADPLALPA